MTTYVEIIRNKFKQSFEPINRLNSSLGARRSKQMKDTGFVVDRLVSRADEWPIPNRCESDYPDRLLSTLLG